VSTAFAPEPSEDEPSNHLPDDLRPEDFIVPDDLSSLLDGSPESSPSGSSDSPGIQDSPSTPDSSNTLADQDIRAALDNLEIPDDLSSLMAPKGLEFACLLTPLAAAEVVAATCAMLHVEADAVESEHGAIAVFRELDPQRAEEAGCLMSKAMVGLDTIYVTRASGQITATHMKDGVLGDAFSPGLLLAGAEDVTEDLVAGITTVADLRGVVTSVGMSKMKAMRILTRKRK
jgi:hypothetical protein